MKIYLKKNEEKRLLAGHPWVYANEVARIEDKQKNGGLCSVYSFDGRFIGKGYVNHLSKILVRIFIRNDDTDDKEFYLKRLKEAGDFRKSLGFENSYRVVFAESDNIPALIVDKYADYLVIQCLSLGIDLRKSLITECLIELFSPKGIYERSDVPVRLKEGLQEFKGVLYGEVPDNIIIEENGLKMSVNIKNGQKTGYFLDQKENRFAVRRYAKDKTVLDCFCNSGGFSVNCATVAKSVTAVDISRIALDNVTENARLNNLSNIETVCGDVFTVLRDYKKAGKKFDTIISDPPAFCKSASEINDAYRGYKDINILAMKLINSGGFLITSSCSHYMSINHFTNMLTDAATESGKRVRLIEVKQQSPDHPSLMTAEETQYLKFFVLQVL